MLVIWKDKSTILLIFVDKSQRLLNFKSKRRYFSKFVPSEDNILSNLIWKQHITTILRAKQQRKHFFKGQHQK